MRVVWRRIKAEAWSCETCEDDGVPGGEEAPAALDQQSTPQAKTTAWSVLSQFVRHIRALQNLIIKNLLEVTKCAPSQLIIYLLKAYLRFVTNTILFRRVEFLRADRKLL